jgi:hypothetical protein
MNPKPAEMVTIAAPTKALSAEYRAMNEVFLVAGFMFDYLLEIRKKRISAHEETLKSFLATVACGLGIPQKEARRSGHAIRLRGGTGVASKRKWRRTHTTALERTSLASDRMVIIESVR